MNKVLVGAGVSAAALAVLIPTTVLADSHGGTPNTSQAQLAQDPAPWIGVRALPLTEGIAQRLSITQTGGLVVIQVVPGSPAAESGLKAKDVILSVNGNAVTDPGHLQQAVKAAGVGGSLTLTVLHGGAEATLAIVVGEAPHRQPRVRPLPIPAPLPPFGAQLGRLGDNLHNFSLTFEDKDGNVVTLGAYGGAVSAVGDASITVTPAAGGAAQTVQITDSISLVKGGHKITVAEIEVGDTVIVYSKNGEVTLVFVGSVKPPLPAPRSLDDGKLRIQAEERLKKFQDEQLPKLEERLKERQERLRQQLEERELKLKERLQQRQERPAPTITTSNNAAGDVV
jgi:membrane-associated protease RseP (regulator of RpoE activity)